MADVWQFSESSLPLLDRCIQAAVQPGTEWLRLFKPEALTSKTDINEENKIPSQNSISTIITENQLEDDTRQANEEGIENICATLEMEPSNKLDYLMNQCVNCDNVLPVLAGKLTPACVDTMCADLFANNVHSSYIDKFFVQFLPVYFKRDISCTSVEMLIRAYKTHSEAGKTLIVALLTSADIPSKLLESFFSTIDNTEHGQFLQMLSSNKLPATAFIQHLNTIGCLYKSSQKTIDVQNFILNCLVSSAKQCCKDKNYGKFLLTYFQSLKESEEPINKYTLQELVNTHETTLARPCLTILNNYK